MQNLKLDKSYQISCNAQEISAIIEKIFSELNQVSNFKIEFKFDFELVLREILANAIEHGAVLAVRRNNKQQDDLNILIKVQLNSSELKLVIKDPGPGFDWENYNLEKMPDFKEYGRGLIMINRVCSQLKFNKLGNEITVIFDL